MIRTAPRVFALSVHAGYQCRRTGACCTAGWSIPLEAPLQRRFGVASLTPEPDGACRFYDRSSGLCRIQRDEGEAMLPTSCREFPRLTLADDRGVFVTLTHFCPTAARMLVHDRAPLAVVPDPPAFPAARDYDGLDARGEWPPLVRPGLLFDLPAYDAWERFVVATCAREDLDPDSVLDRLAAAADIVRAWTPGRERLTEVISHAAGADRVDPAASARYDAWRGIHGYRLVTTAATGTTATTRDGLKTVPYLDGGDEGDRFVRPRWSSYAGAVRRYLAARAFGSWSAYQVRGLRSMVAELVATGAVLRSEAARACASAGRELDDDLMVEALRAADGLLVHGVDRARLVRLYGRVEES
ncbi:MAG: hypothetical protein ACM3SQ_18280 [Betaproteobacteria bacterium]